jgi:hypothetical protein
MAQLLIVASNRFNKPHDTSPQLGILDLHECFRKRESVTRRKKLVHVVGGLDLAS